jgi:SAM-dependent methyltransferase
MDIRKKQTQQNYDEIAQLYTKDFGEKIIFFDKFLDPLALSLKRDNLMKPIVDLGSGSGNVIDYLIKLGVKNEIVGVDFSKRFCKILKKKYVGNKNIKIINKDFVDYIAKQKSDSVSAYISNYSTIHVLDEEIDFLMKNIYRSLEKKGLVVFSVYEGTKKGMELEPYQVNKDSRFKTSVKGFLSSYINNFTGEEVKRMFTSVGFRVIKMKKYQLEEMFGDYNQPEFWVLAQK